MSLYHSGPFLPLWRERWSWKAAWNPEIKTLVEPSCSPTRLAGNPARWLVRRKSDNDIQHLLELSTAFMGHNYPNPSRGFGKCSSEVVVTSKGGRFHCAALLSRLILFTWLLSTASHAFLLKSQQSNFTWYLYFSQSLSGSFLCYTLENHMATISVLGSKLFVNCTLGVDFYCPHARDSLCFLSL